MRGAESSDADRAAWAAQAGATPVQQPPGWQRWLRFWWIPVVGAALVFGYFSTVRRGDDGSVTGGGQMSVTEIRVGDCFNAADEAEISDVDAVPCTEPHAYEAYVVEDHASGTYPTGPQWDEVFASRCITEFESYVGAPYETSEIYAGMMTPTTAGWDAGDREIVCYLLEPEPGSTTEVLERTTSLRNAAR